MDKVINIEEALKRKFPPEGPAEPRNYKFCPCEDLYS